VKDGRMYKQFPSYDIKIMNAKLGKEIWTGIAVSNCELHYEVNDNVLILVHQSTVNTSTQ
jgi:hypothetical protein